MAGKNAMQGIKNSLERVLEIISLVLVSLLLLVVIVGVFFRYMGESLGWYDEVASIMLAWLTYFASSLAALKRGHIGFPGLVKSLPQGLKVIAFVFAETIVYAFFIIVGYYGYVVLDVLEGETLISLPWVPAVLVQSIIPIGAFLFLVAETLSLPDGWKCINAPKGASGEAACAIRSDTE